MIQELDKRLRKLFKTGQRTNHRSLCVLLGEKGSEKVVDLCLLYKSCGKEFSETSKSEDLAVLWNFRSTASKFKKENDEVINSLNAQALAAHYSSYKDTREVVHQTYDIVILQDIESISMKDLSSLISVVHGGGVIIMLLKNIKDLQELDNAAINSNDKVSRFRKRLILSIKLCSNSLILDYNLKVLSSNFTQEKTTNEKKKPKDEIEKIQENYEKDSIIYSLLDICQTLDQAELLIQFLDIIEKRTFHGVCSVSSPVGRGKSAALGLAIAGSLAFNYSNIFISSMHYKNVQTVFRFLLKGLDALKYEEDQHFDLIQSVHPKLENALTGINIFKDHPQSVRFIFPNDIQNRLDQAELLVLDEAATIPSCILKNMFGSYVALMASSTSGSGSSSSYLYSSMVSSIQSGDNMPSEGERFRELTLTEPIHFADGDGVETWLNEQCCTDSIVSSQISGFPLPDLCNLFCVNRDGLFSGTKEAEKFLKSLTTLLFSADTTIDPDKLVDLADSPDYQIFCLLAPDYFTKSSSNIICIIVVHLEAQIPDHIIHCGSNLSDSTSHCFNEWKSKTTASSTFSPNQGIHIMNVVTHLSYRKMGYGLRSLQLLQDFYEGKCISLDEEVGRPLDGPIASQQPILLKLTDVTPDPAEFALVSCGLDPDSLRFWKKAGFIPTYITETLNDEGVYVIFMVKSVLESFRERLERYWFNFQNYYCILLGSAFRDFKASLSLSLMHFNPNVQRKELKDFTKDDIDALIKPHHMKSLEKYCQNLQEFHSIVQFIPTLATLFFKNHMKGVQLPRVQEAILLSYGLQFKTADEISADLKLPNIQVHGLLNRTMKKVVRHLSEVVEKSVEQALDKDKKEVVMQPIIGDMHEELEKEGQAIMARQKIDALQLRDLDVSQYAIKGSEDDWETALQSGRKALVSIKSIKKIVNADKLIPKEDDLKKGKKKKRKQR